MDAKRTSFGAFLLAVTLWLADPLQARSMTVTATAYNSIVAQTDSTPHIGACNEPMESRNKIVAVSRDLFEIGLDCGTKVKIHGVGVFVVLDKMDDRWRKRIDIHMGKKVGKALAWGERKVRISW
ncbi:3D domain-containing protein [Methylocaldum sp. MU1018]